ncbi:DUF1272 domain-containing protein [Microbacterium marinum]|uniref:DUF1272 domain-containing protein n=1 Tax=Microbacterium marinum TaxID=421115 RepID=UPI001FE438B6|nr:DUF1272 domain-containing protein [Microbacterium marinum]
MRPTCESCGTAAAADGEAYICSYECTWCAGCVDTFPGGACPNCGGALERRPTRVAAS